MLTTPKALPAIIKTAKEKVDEFQIEFIRNENENVWQMLVNVYRKIHMVFKNWKSNEGRKWFITISRVFNSTMQGKWIWFYFKTNNHFANAIINLSQSKIAAIRQFLRRNVLEMVSGKSI